MSEGNSQNRNNNKNKGSLKSEEKTEGIKLVEVKGTRLR